MRSLRRIYPPNRVKVSEDPIYLADDYPEEDELYDEETDGEAQSEAAPEDRKSVV